MSGLALLFFVIAAVLVWGGLIGSIIALAVKPEVSAYPAGGEDGDDLDTQS
ncbi:MetS family NSS transporter small subunit [Microbacterium sp. G2-8]|uniref:MetS family NSS transporter small subunit n=1 Tax=Microbacterium sp. G2-8 TaxID=2842454 RepID=UPI001C89098D|nr:MetS family NSS transporter small subunit [Microbacterium sp. G2-8]